MKFKPLALALPLLAVSATGPVGAAHPVADRATPEQSSIRGEKDYIEYLPGNSPVIITAPHGGNMMPDSIPTRTAEACGGSAVTVMDTNTLELAKAIREGFYKRYGTYPHVIVAHIARKKLDPNRPLEEAACGSAEATQAFNEWHRFIDQAKAQVLRDYGKGWFMDIHGHGHPIQRIEIGYLLKTETVNLSSEALDADPALRDRVSFRTIAKGTGLPLSELIRGPNAIGTLFEKTGFPAVPSQQQPSPGDNKYFSAGYNTLRHGCSAQAAANGGDPSGAICSVQFETNYKGLRDTAANRERFGDATAAVIGYFLKRFYALDLAAKPKKR